MAKSGKPSENIGTVPVNSGLSSNGKAYGGAVTDGKFAPHASAEFSRMRSMTSDTMVNTEMFYAPDACERVVALFRSFG